MSEGKIAIQVALYGMQTGLAQKFREMGKKMEKGPRPEMVDKWPTKWKMDPKIGVLPILGHFFHFGGHFSTISGLGPFSFFLSHFLEIFVPVHGHLDRDTEIAFSMWIYHI